MELVQNEKVMLEQNAMEELIKLTAGELMIINQEIKKLSTYVGEGGTISKEDVRDLVPRSLEQNIFELIENVVQRKSSEAFRFFMIY